MMNKTRLVGFGARRWEQAYRYNLCVRREEYAMVCFVKSFGAVQSQYLFELRILVSQVEACKLN